MPVYQKDKNHWHVVVHYKGKRKDREFHGTKAEAEAYEARLRVKLEQHDPSLEIRNVPTFSDFCITKYSPHAKKHLKARTWTNRSYTLATLSSFFGDVKLNEIIAPIAEPYQNQRIDEGIGPSTINDEIKILRAVLNYARSLGYPVSPLKLKDLPTRSRKRVKFWTADQVRHLLEAVVTNSPSIYWLVVFMLETGVRRGEALALEFQDVDLVHGMVRIQPNEEWQPKDNEAREIPLNRKGALLAWIKDEHTSGRRFVFVNRKKQPWKMWPQRAFDTARKAAALTGGPHTTRHTFATHFLARVPDLYLLGKLLGHSHERVTKLYAHLLPDHLDRARGAVGFVSEHGHAEMAARVKWSRK